MPDHLVKEQPAVSTYVREKGCVKKNCNRDAPCSRANGVDLLHLGYDCYESR